MISCPTIQKQVIRQHYDYASLFYRLLWGQHIHHGLWEGQETPRQAQLNLTRTLARLAHLQTHSRILDVGCGLGGSAIHLAQTLGCHVTGVTISPVQQRWASWTSRWHRVDSRSTFLCADAEQVDFPADSFDAVWSVECTEHLFDKARFFQRVAQWVRPGGSVAICAWLANEQLSAHQETQIQQVCEGMFCPSLGTRQDYADWMERAGLRVELTQDWTAQVERTWHICQRRVRWTGMPWLAHLFGRDMVLFINRFRAMIDAYGSGAMKYGCLVATRPETGAQGSDPRNGNSARNCGTAS